MTKKQRSAADLAAAGARLEKKITELEQQVKLLRQQRRELREKENEMRGLEIIGIIEDSEISFDDAKDLLARAKEQRKEVQATGGKV